MLTSLSLSRRHLLGLTAASLAATLGTDRVAVAAQSSGLNLGIQLYSLRGFKVNEALAHAKSLGFTHVEFYSGMLATNASAEEIASIKKQVSELGLTISAHGVNRFSKDADANRAIFQFAKSAGIGTITADPDPDSFANLDQLVKEFDIRVAIHNHGPRHRYNKPLDVLHAIDGHDERIGACADLGHYIRSGEQPVEVIQAFKGRLYGIHLKDFATMEDKAKGVILGVGHLNCLEVFEALKNVGFPADGALSLEYEENESNPLDDIRQCVLVARTALAKL